MKAAFPRNLSLPGFVAAILAFAVATAGTILLWDAVFHRVPFALFFAAVAFAAWRAGWGAGIGVGVAGILTISIHQQFSLGLIAPSIILLTVSVFISLIAAARARTLHALAKSEQRLNSLVSQSAAGIAQTDLTGRILFANDRYCQIVGFPRHELLNMRVHDLTHPDDLAVTAQSVTTAAATGREYVLEKRYLRKDGSTVWISVSAGTLKNDAGNPESIIGVVVDISERKRAEHGLLSSQARLASVVQTALDCIIGMDRDGNVIEWNPAAEKTFGFTRAEVLGQEMAPLIIPPELRDAHRRGLGHYLATGEGPVLARRLELTAIRKSGEEFPVELTINPDLASSPPTFTAFIRDLTQRQLAESALRESEERLRMAVAIAQMGAFEIDLRTDAVTVNEIGREIYGWAPDELLTFSKVQTHFHADDAEEVLRRVTQAFDPRGSGEFEVEQRIIRTDGAVRWIRVKGRALFETVAGVPQATRCLGTYLDITRDKNAQQEREQLLLSERVAREEAERSGRMKDEFLATLSHELRTPLNAILGWSQILSHGRPDHDEVGEGLRTIERNARVQAQIIEDLLDMSRIISGKVRLDVQPVDLASVVREAISTAKPSADAKGIRLLNVLDPHAGPVSGDPARLQQVMWNLISNAVKFTPRGGRVQVVLERINSHVEISVIDSGEGIDPAFLPFVFDRFRQADASTTRRHGGLGIGLSIVKQLVELHGGTVSVKSLGENQGATFSVSLPLTALHPVTTSTIERRHPTVAVSSSSMLDSCGQLTGVKVLVIDDEPDARALVKRLLEDCHGSVITAGSASEALDLLQSEKPDVLVCDIGMPVEDGYTFIQRVRALSIQDESNVPAVALTAYARAEDRVRAMRAGFQLHLAKPVEPAELIVAVASLAKRTGHA